MLAIGVRTIMLRLVGKWKQILLGFLNVTYYIRNPNNINYFNNQHIFEF